MPDDHGGRSYSDGGITSISAIHVSDSHGGDGQRREDNRRSTQVEAVDDHETSIGQLVTILTRNQVMPERKQLHEFLISMQRYKGEVICAK